MAIVELISPDANRRIKLCGDGCTLPYSLLNCPPPLMLVLSFPHFCGEPDGGLAFPGQVIPFIVVEVGVSDSATKTNGRMEHWLRRASGHVLIALLTSLMAR